MQLQFCHQISNSTEGTSPWSCFCQGRWTALRYLEEDWVGICSELQSCPVKFKWSRSGSQGEASSQGDPTNWISVPSPTAPQSRILGHSPGWNISPSSLPAQSWLCFSITSHCSQDEVPSSMFQPALRSCHLLLSRDTGWGHTENKDTQHTPGRCRLCAPGAYSIYFPWNLVGRIQSM